MPQIPKIDIEAIYNKKEDKKHQIEQDFNYIFQEDFNQIFKTHREPIKTQL